MAAQAPRGLAEQTAEAILGANPFVGIDSRQVVADVARAAAGVARRPRRLASELVRTAGEMRGALNGEVRVPEGDRRFADAAWSSNPVYRRLAQSYLTLSKAGHRLVDEAGLSPLDAQRAHFGVNLVADALAPTNGLLTNPAALKRAFDTGGQSLVRGGRNLLRDVRENGGMPATVDKTAFGVGRNLATSPGAVVRRGAMYELIQYRPLTDTVHQAPLVVIPPQINKFYVLDLAPGRSFVEHAVASGIPYFAISWRNPTADQRSWGLDQYVKACLDAVATASEICGGAPVHVMGLCAGGVTMSLLLGYLEAKGELDRIASATFAVSMLDMKAPSTATMLASDAVIAMALRRSRDRGVLDGAEMARVFAWMRPNDLVWNYWVNNYLMGEAPPAFDILYWNADTTRLPAQLHADFLDLYVRNPLVEPKDMSVLGRRIDLGQVDCPAYIVAGVTDHIVPWTAAYRTARLLGGRPEFVLSSSGHIQSIVNPPSNPKASFFAADSISEDSAGWLDRAKEHRGSWWTHWAGWIGERSGDRRPAPKQLGSRKHRPRGEAPGRYVHQT